MRTAVSLAGGAAAVALVAYPTWRAPTAPVAAIGAAALILMLAGTLTLRWAPSAGGLAASLCQYALALLVSGDTIDVGAVAAAAGIVLHLELLDVAMVLRRSGTVDAQVVPRLARHAVGTGVVGLTVSVGVVVAGAATAGGQLALLAAAAGSSAAAFALVVRLTRTALE